MTGELERLRNSYEPVRLGLGAARGVLFTEQHDGSAHVEFNDGRYQYVVTDRGVEFKRRSASGMDEIMYWLARDESFSQACDFELQNRIPNRDSRRLIFAKQNEILARVDPQWAARSEREQEEILRNHPFNDRAGSL
jgi:hypothetical protein